MRRFAASLIALSALAAPVVAQQPGSAPTERQLIDRVVAVVGDTVLLLSDVQADLQQMQAAGRPIPEDERARAAMIQELLDTRVNDLLLVTAARQAGITVRDEEIAATVDQQVRAAQSQFRTEAEFREALAVSGMTLEAYRQMIGTQYRNQSLAQRFMQQRLATAARPQVSDAEIREVFESQRGQLGERPATVSFQQVLVEVRPADDAREAARTRALGVLEELRGGAAFDVLARRHSDDPGSREQGGDLGWFRRGRMVPAFENAVWAMRPGDVSGLVETDFGFHIIRLERVRGGERQARHVLIRPEISTEAQQAAFERADSIATAARGGANFNELIRRYPTSGENRVDRVPLDRLPPVYANLLDDALPNQVVGPFEEQGPTGSRWVVLRMTDRGAAGEWTFEDVRDQIRERIQEQQMVEQLVADLKRTTYVSIML
jgi:peptidyl-prolyl cis-trans isomerase SurA